MTLAGASLMELQHHLTTEKLKRKYQKDNAEGCSSFDLIHYAISVAENMVLTDRDSTVPTIVRNRAYQALLEMFSGKAKFAEVRENIEAPSLNDPSRASIVAKAKEAQGDSPAVAEPTPTKDA